MKRLVSLVVCVGIVFGSDTPLCERKVEILKLKRQQIQEEVDVQKNSWISPLRFSLSVDENRDANDRRVQTKNAALDWSQDVFRSGGIHHSIDKAKALGRVNMFGVAIEEANYLKQIYTLQAQILRDRLKYEQSELTLKNRDIDLFIIKEKYKAGMADVSELNRVAIDKDNARVNLIVVKNLLRTQEYGLKKLINYEKDEAVVLPDVPFISKSEYLKSNFELLRYDAQDKRDYAELEMTKSSYLPKLTLNASAGYSDGSGDVVDNGGENYRYGATLSMPLDVNAKAAVEYDRLGLARTRELRVDREMELEQEYETRVATIADYEEKIVVADETLKTYDELYDFTQSQVKSGFKSAYELESLGNSIKIQRLEKEAHSYNVLIEKIALYFDMKR